MLRATPGLRYDYYLTEGTGVARRFVTRPDGPVVELASLTGDGYEMWVAGLDPETGQPRGRLRADASAVRFVEIVVNGPKSWSLAAEMHPDLAAAYEAAHDRPPGSSSAGLPSTRRRRSGRVVRRSRCRWSGWRREVE